jgi:t-SNARE complex subunit (syntaxin)
MFQLKRGRLTVICNASVNYFEEVRRYVWIGNSCEVWRERCRNGANEVNRQTTAHPKCVSEVTRADTQECRRGPPCYSSRPLVIQASCKEHIDTLPYKTITITTATATHTNATVNITNAINTNTIIIPSITTTTSMWFEYFLWYYYQFCYY